MQFISFDITPTEKHIGIATIRLYDNIIFRFKILPTKDGLGFFSTPASHKITKNGKDTYVPAFLIDSRMEDEKIREFIRTNVRSAMGSPKASMNGTALAQPSLSGIGPNDPFF